MKLLKRKDSLTFKREKPLAKQERIYLVLEHGGNRVEAESFGDAVLKYRAPR